MTDTERFQAELAAAKDRQAADPHHLAGFAWKDDNGFHQIVPVEESYAWNRNANMWVAVCACGWEAKTATTWARSRSLQRRHHDAAKEGAKS